MIMFKRKLVKSKRNIIQGFWAQMVLGTIVFALLAMPAIADDGIEMRRPWTKYEQEHQENEQPWGATSIVIETTDNDIELQVFVDGFLWKSLQVFAPDERRIFNLKAQRNIKRQGGLSELFLHPNRPTTLRMNPNLTER